jgi:outer membrane protein assembly factor BamB
VIEVKKENLKLKSKISIVTLTLILTISAVLTTLPSAAAQEQSKDTVCYLGAMPNPVGVNQPVLLHVGITDYLSSTEMGFEGLTVSVIDPEGIETSIGPIRTDATGGTGYLFTPKKAGKHILQAHFPTQTILVTPFFWGAPYNLTFLASDSEIVELEVLSEPIDYYPGHSLPSEYWDRPIDAQLREWSAVSGSWPTIPENMYAQYNDGPETAHILWTKPFTTGGLAGGELGGLSFEIGDAYEGKWSGSSGAYSWHSTSIILVGKLIYKAGGSSSIRPVVYHCVDLHTGEELWTKTFLDNRTIAFGQTFYWEGFNMHGAFAYLWVTVSNTWYAFDAFTGDWRFTLENVPSGTRVYDELNHIYIVSVNQNGWMGVWDMTASCLGVATGYGAGSWGNTVTGKTIDADEYPEAWTNVTIQTGLTGVQRAWYGDRVIGGSVSQEEVTLWGLNLNSTEGPIGKELFDNTWQAPDYWTEMNLTVSGFQGGFFVWSQKDKVAILWLKETREHYAFSLETGEKIWGPTPRQHYLDAMEDSIAESRTIAYGKFYSASVGGILYCYDVSNGTLLWTYEATDPYSEMLWSNNWWIKPLFVTDGKIYVAHLEHSPVDPRPRGAPFVCVDAETGDEIWRIDGAFRQTRWGGRAIIGDSIIATQNTYDQRVYAIGKGPSATTVTVSPKVVAQGSSILIEGTVMDVSPGTEDAMLRMRFPNGVPAISDESMSEWMKYVYMQFGIPADPTGVEVVFNAVDSDGTWLDVDRTTTDMSGAFSYAWTPPAEGKYTIVATFMGSGGYYASYAQTAVEVGPAPAAYPVPPTADEIAAETISRLPAYPEAPSATAVAQETISQLPAYPEIPDIPAYLTIDLAIIVAVVIAIIIGLYGILKKQK